MSTVRVRGYRRVSTDEQAATGHSLPAQKEAVERFVDYHRDWTLVEWYTDDGYSAKSLDRPAFKRMIGDAKPGDVILVYKLDRLTRSSKDLEYMLEELAEKRSIYIRSVTENIETTTAAGRMFIRQLIQFAQFERETIAERVTMGMRQKKNSGGWIGGTVPFGYVAVPSDRIKAGKVLKKLVHDEKNAHLAQSIFERYLAGNGVRAIAKWLNDVGAKTSRNAAWRSLAVIRVLKNPAYCGLFYATDCSLVRGEHEPLIDRATWDKVQAVFEQRKLLAPREATGKYPLAGVCRCGSCLAPITITVHRRKLKSGEDAYYYRCKAYHEGRKCGEPALTTFVGPVAEAKVKDALVGRLTQNIEETVAEMQRDAEKRLNTSGAEVERMKEALADVEAAINRWDAAYGSGRLPLERYLQNIEECNTKREALIAQLAEATPDVVIPRIDDIRTLGDAVAATWDECEPHERKALLLDVLTTLRWTILLHHGQRVEVVPKPLSALLADGR